jgi:hypothetical protein
LSGTVSADHCPDFTVLSGGTYSLTHDQTQTVTIFYFASTAGPQSCAIDAGNEACTDVYCTAYGGSQPVCLIEPDTLDYGFVTVGDSLDLAFIITNAGGDTLNGTVSEACDHYEIVTGGGAYALAADESVTVTVRYKPAAPGTHTCTVETGSAACVDVYCSGSADNPPVCVIEPDTLDYGEVVVGDSLDMAFDVINAGGGMLSGSVSDTSSCYDVASGGGPYALAADETLHVTVRFKPDGDGTFVCSIETGTADCADVHCTGFGKDMTGMRIVKADRFHLYQNYPNPFNPTTNITFTLAARSRATLVIYNIEGKVIRTLVDEELDAGVKTIIWNGRDGRGNPVSTGVYFYRLRAGANVTTRKMVLLK